MIKKKNKKGVDAVVSCYSLEILTGFFFFFFYKRRNSSRELTVFIWFQDGFAPPEELEGDGLAPDDEEQY